MVLDCSFCGSKRGSESKGRTFHRFPLNDEKRLQAWLKNMGLGSTFQPTKRSLLCSNHFEEKCFNKFTYKKCLCVGSVPTLFQEYKAFCVYCRALKAKGNKVSFRKFPLHNPILLKKWLAAMKLKNFVPTERSLICDDHFDENSFRSSGDRRLILKANAVPTLFSSRDVTSFEMQESESNPSSKIDNSHTDRLTNLQEGDSSLRGTRRSGNTCTNTPEKEAAANFFLVERCNGNEGPSESATITAKTAISPVFIRTAETPRSIEKRVFITQHDHQYEIPPEIMRERYIKQQEKIKTLMNQARVHKQRISRLDKTVSSLKELVKKLKKRCTAPIQLQRIEEVCQQHSC